MMSETMFPLAQYSVNLFVTIVSISVAELSSRVGEGGGGTWVNVCWVCAAGLSEPLPHYSLFLGQL